jgi:quercetin dioxygenase-like cupin family protein
MDYTYIANLTSSEIPAEGIHSRTVYHDDGIRVTYFAFAAGEALTEHTASRPAILHFLQGEAALTLGEDEQLAGPGTWVHMPANLPHSIHATTPVIMLLTLLSA